MNHERDERTQLLPTDKAKGASGPEPGAAQYVPLATTRWRPRTGVSCFGTWHAGAEVLRWASPRPRTAQVLFTPEGGRR
jgi:hypothetical protein